MDLKQECEKTFYRELYHFDDRAQSLVMDETTQRLYLQKEAGVYDERVYRYLKENRNPHVAYVHSFWKEDGKLVVLEEYIEGTTLEQWLASAKEQDRTESAPADVPADNSLPPRAERMRIFREICEGLSFLHHAKPPLIHRDLKASNVMIAKDGTVKLIDYDAARVDDGEAGQQHDTVLMGTKGSAAPEQYGFAPSDARTDLYALGVLMRLLFPGDDAMKDVITKATRMDKEDRYGSVEELLRAAQSAESRKTAGRTSSVGGEINAGSGETKEYLRMWGFMGLIAAAITILTALLNWGGAGFGSGADTGSAAASEITAEAEGSAGAEDPAGAENPADAESASGAGNSADAERTQDVVKVRPITSKRTRTLGGLRLYIPKSWTVKGNYYYAETGTGSTMLMVGMNDDVQFSSYEEFDNLSGEIMEALTVGLAGDSSMVVKEREDTIITVNGIEMVRSVFDAETGNVGLSGELELIYDDVTGSIAVLYFLQSEHASRDYFDAYHGILASVEKVAVLDGVWEQENRETGQQMFTSVKGYHIAEIGSDGTITIHWYDEEMDVQALFWRGSYEAPLAEDEVFSWESYPDEEEMEKGGLFPDTSTLLFTYVDGTISYDATVSGETKTIRLKRRE